MTLVPNPSSAFPSWCTCQGVPELYHLVEKYVTRNGSSDIDNSLLLPVLMSSGLPREVLAHIWEMINLSRPGILVQQELYATLAIVALYQMGYRAQGLQALLYFPSPPIPYLVVPNPFSADGHPLTKCPTLSDIDQLSQFSLDSTTHPPALQPTQDRDWRAAQLTQELSGLTGHSPSPWNGNQLTTDDFGDFKQAEGMVLEVLKPFKPLIPWVKREDNLESDSLSLLSLDLQPNVPCLLSSLAVDGTGASSDEFGDFLCAPATLLNPEEAKKVSFSQPPSSVTSSSEVVTDKYSFIRSLSTPPTMDKVSLEFAKCLRICQDLLEQIGGTLELAKDQNNVMEELCGNPRFQNYIQNVVFLFCIVRRIYASALTSGRLNGEIQTWISRIDQSWDQLTLLLGPYQKLPKKSSMDFTSAAFKSSQSDSSEVCGVCRNYLLKEMEGEEVEPGRGQLVYGGLSYHTTCANFWVNYVDFLLPGL